MSQPTPLAAVIAAGAVCSHFDGWMGSDMIRIELRHLGFDTTPQQVVTLLRRMCREDAPRFESRDRGGYKEYRLTRWARDDLDWSRAPSCAWAVVFS